ISGSFISHTSLCLGGGRILLTHYDDDPNADHVKWVRQIISSGAVSLCPLLSNSGQTRVRLECPLSQKRTHAVQQKRIVILSPRRRGRAERRRDKGGRLGDKIPQRVHRNESDTCTLAFYIT